MYKIISILTLTAIVVFTASAQDTSNSAVAKSSPAVKKELSPAEKLQQKLYDSNKNPAEFAMNLAEMMNEFPYYWISESGIYSLGSVTKTATPAETKTIIAKLVESTDRIPAPLRANLYLRSSSLLFNKEFYPEAADLSKKAIELLNEADYIDFKKKSYDYGNAENLKKTPNFKPRPFGLDRAKVDFIGLKTSAYNNFGKSLWEQNRAEEAEKAYRDSFAVKVSKESALGIAKAAEKNGKETEALKYATIAALTGRLEPTEMDYFISVYAKQHQGKTDDVEEYLNTEFKKNYHNPIKSEKYKKTANRTNRTVLAEFFTGTACTPCIPFDYSFEKVLENYSGKEINLLVYHMHAPLWDSLSNYPANSREKYYDVHGAPNVFIDGVKFKDENDDYNGGKDEAGKIQTTYDALNKNLKIDLETPTNADIKLKAERSGQLVKVNVNADKLQNVSDDVTLQIALVENEVLFSGENGLRFQMMVVRALAGDSDKRVFGFKIDQAKANKFDFTFDVDKIIAQNGSYYDTFKVEKEKEFAERFGGKVPEGVEVKFKYKKNQIDSKSLSVVVFLQDNKTKKILQSASVNLAAR